MPYLKIVLVVGIALTGVLWSMAIIPAISNDQWFNSLNPPEQYVVYNIGIFLIVMALFGGLISFALMRRMNLLNMIVNGLAGFLIFSFFIDMFQPPFAVSHSGEFIIAAGASVPTLAGASVDYMTAWTWTQIGIHGSALYYMTYAVTPAIAVFVAVLLFGLNRFLNLFAESV